MIIWAWRDLYRAMGGGWTWNDRVIKYHAARMMRARIAANRSLER